jgi:hypothetical protein
LEQKESLFSSLIPAHVEQASTLKDLTALFQIESWLGIVPNSAINQAWVRVSANSNFLKTLGESISEHPIADAVNKAEEQFRKDIQAHELREHSLEFELSNLRSKVESLQEALERGREAIGGTKMGMEASLARKYTEGIARLVRRLERESGQKPFSEIISREAQGLARLGIELLSAGSDQAFDPAVHDSVGKVIERESLVKILETGVLLSLGNDKITILKAVVRPAS